MITPAFTDHTMQRLQQVAATQGTSVDDLVNNLLDTHGATSTKQTKNEALHELNDLKTRFMRMVSHEFRTPLAAIQSSSEILTRYADRLSDEQRHTRLHNICQQVEHLREMLERTESLLEAHTTPSAAFRESADLDTLLTDTIDNHADNVPVVHYVEGEQRPVNVDCALLEQAVVNLIQNAVKYSPPGAKIEVSQHYTNEHVYIAVKDSGIGIAEQDLQYVFEPFFRGDNVDTIPGTGLGLSMVRHAVEAHGGDVYVYSALEYGTVVLLRLPYGDVSPIQVSA